MRAPVDQVARILTLKSQRHHPDVEAQHVCPWAGHTGKMIGTSRRCSGGTRATLTMPNDEYIVGSLWAQPADTPYTIRQTHGWATLRPYAMICDDM